MHKRAFLRATALALSTLSLAGLAQAQDLHSIAPDDSQQRQRGTQTAERPHHPQRPLEHRSPAGQERGHGREEWSQHRQQHQVAHVSTSSCSPSGAPDWSGGMPSGGAPATGGSVSVLIIASRSSLPTT